MIRVALLSFWHVHASDYARDAADHPDTEIVAVWDEVAERGRAEAARRGARFFERLDELLAQPDIHGVVVTAPTRLHREVMVAAAQAGKHIFTEKVIAATLREAEEIVAAAEQAGVRFVVALRRLSEAPTREIRAIVDQGLLGDLTLVRARDAHSGALPTDGQPRGWLVDHFFDPAQAQGGAMIDLGCHPMYLTRYFLGMPDSVSATYGFVTGRPVEDNAVATLCYPNGAIGIVETGFVTPYSPFTIELYGTCGTLLYGVDGKLHLRGAHIEGAADQWLARQVTAAPAAPPFSQWVTHIQQGTPATENVALGLELSALLEAANQAAASGRAVRLDTLARAAQGPSRSSPGSSSLRSQ